MLKLSNDRLFQWTASGIALSSAALLALYDWNARIPLFLLILAFASAVYAVAVRSALSGRFDTIRNLQTKIIVSAIVFRCIVFFCPPTISEDIYRYVWDGKVQNAGYLPYAYPPEAEELKALRDADYEKINHKDFRTAYPPFAQILFRALATISTKVLFFKLAILAFDILLLFLLRNLLSRHGHRPGNLLIYAWHPLILVEFAGSGHMDIIALSLLFVSILLLERSHNVSAGVALAAAVLTKYLPVISLPWTLPKGRWKFALAFAATIIILLIPYYSTDFSIFYGLSVFYRKWWFNDSLFGILRALMGGAEPARITGAVVTCCVALLCAWRKLPFYRSFFLIYATVIVFAPVVHPWYVCWLVPFLVFHRNPAWLFFTCWVGASYLIREVSPVGVWRHEAWLKVFVYAPLYTGMLVSLLAGFYGNRATGAGAVRRS